MINEKSIPSEDPGARQAENERLRSRVDELERQLGQAEETASALQCELNSTQSLLRQILDNLPLCFALKDKKNNVLLSNTRMAQLLNKTVPEMEGRHTTEIVAEGAIDYYKDDKAVIDSQCPRRGIVEYVQIDDSTRRWVQTDKCPWFDEHGVAGVMVLCNEITEEIKNTANSQTVLSSMIDSLKEIEERYFLAFLGAQDGLWDFTLDGSRRSFVSIRCKKILGFEAGDIGEDYRSWWRRIHPYDRTRARQVLERHLRHHDPYDLDVRFQCKAGYYRWMNLRGQAVWDEQGGATRICGSMRDVTDKKMSEFILASQYNCANAMLASANLNDFYLTLPKLVNGLGWAGGAVWLVEEGTAGKKVRLARVIGACQRLYDDWCLPEASETIKSVVDENRLVFETITEAPSRRAALAREHGFKQIIIFPLVSGDKIVGVAELFHPDVRERRDDMLNMTQLLGSQVGSFIDRMQISKSLQERDYRLSSILDTAPDGIITLSGKNIITANSAAASIFGFEPDALVGHSIDEIIPDFFSSLPAGLEGKYEHGRPILLGKEMSSLRQNGTSFPAEVSVSAFPVNDQMTLTAIVRDITERKAIEQRVSEFYSIVSHELRTPITSIRGSLGLMEEGITGDLPEMAAELVGIARSESDRLIRLINDILDFRKFAEGKLKLQINSHLLREIVTDALNGVAGFAHQHEVTVHGDTDTDSVVDCDRDRTIQVLTNLLSNAIKFSPSGGQIILKARRQPGEILFSVRDQGCGIPRDQLNKLFVPFQQLDSSDRRLKGGTGLGLAICKAIVGEHKGRIGVDSQIGEGSTFWFTIPDKVRGWRADPTMAAQIQTVQLPRTGGLA